MAAKKPLKDAPPAKIPEVVPEFNANRDPKARVVLHVRCQNSTQIGAFGSSLDAARHQLEMELRPDLGGVLVSANLGGKEREFLVPTAACSHIELEPLPAEPSSEE